MTSSFDLEHSYIHQAIDAAFSTIEQIQQLMSFHHADSELSMLNRTAHQYAVKVHPLIYAVLHRAQKMFLASEGLFDSTIADMLVTWALLPQHSNTQHLYEPVNQTDVILLPNGMVRYKKPLLLDLGGIAKGFAIDLAIQTLRQFGIKNAVVNAGGDLRVLGDTPEPISIRSPSHPQLLIPAGELSNGALATSGIYYSERTYRKNKISALVNPVNRQPIVSPHSFSVIAPTAWSADALTKIIAITGDPNHPCLKHFGATALILH